MEYEKIILMLNETTAEYRKLLSNELNARWESLKLDLMKSYEYEVIWGMVSRQCSFVYQMSYSYYTWNEFFLPIIMRCMAENYINLAWILKEPENRTKMFVEYGLGRETKILEYARAKEKKTEIDHQYIESTENWINEQSFYFLNNINLGSWKFGDVRNTAIDAGMKEYYDMFYDVGSFAVHSTWNYISKHNLKMCESPFHKDHRIPVIKEPMIDSSMFLILCKIMKDTFVLVDTFYKINSDASSAFEYLNDNWNNARK